jgi:hypothetical protein
MDYNKSNRGADGEKKASHRRRSAKVRTVGQRLARLRMNPAMIVRFAAAPEITTDELLQPKAAQTPLRRKPSLRVLRRLERIERMPLHQQTSSSRPSTAS